MPVTGPDFISLQARDLDASAAFYERTSASSGRRPGRPTPSSSTRSRSRSPCATSFPAPTSTPPRSPASARRSGSTPPTCRRSTTRSSRTGRRSSPARRRPVRSDLHLRRPGRLPDHPSRPRLTAFAPHRCQGRCVGDHPRARHGGVDRRGPRDPGGPGPGAPGAPGRDVAGGGVREPGDHLAPARRRRRPGGRLRHGVPRSRWRSTPPTAAAACGGSTSTPGGRDGATDAPRSRPCARSSVGAARTRAS